MTEPSLAEAWLDLGRRRPGLRDTLGVYGRVFETWARWSPPRPLSLSLGAAACRRHWEGGVPLLEPNQPLRAADVEELLGGAMEVLAHAVPTLGAGLQHFADAWDAGRLGPRALLPIRGSVGSDTVEEATGLAGDVIALLATMSLRPVLQVVFAEVREYLADGLWRLGICPFCGGPPGFTDVIEDGRRRLACHVCGGGWVFTKLGCPFCGVEGAQHLVRLTPEDVGEQGYVIAGCRQCHAYLKELDRRARWNGGPPLVEDWGSPHFDLIARRQGFWRPEASLVLLAGNRSTSDR